MFKAKNFNALPFVHERTVDVDLKLSVGLWFDNRLKLRISLSEIKNKFLQNFHYQWSCTTKSNRTCLARNTVEEKDCAAACTCLAPIELSGDFSSLSRACNAFPSSAINSQQILCGKRIYSCEASSKSLHLSIYRLKLKCWLFERCKVTKTILVEIVFCRIVKKITRKFVLCGVCKSWNDER